MAGLDNIMGCIDGTHIEIQGIGQYRCAYTTRKLIYAINTTIVCDSYKRIRFASVGCPGAYNDCRVFDYTPFALNSEAILGVNSVLLGDSAYTLTKHMVVPYSTPNSVQKAFNYIHAKTRVTVENAFGLLKGKWKICASKVRIKRSVVDTVAPIRASIVLHNVCINECIPELDPVSLEELLDFQEILIGNGEFSP